MFERTQEYLGLLLESMPAVPDTTPEAAAVAAANAAQNRLIDRQEWIAVISEPGAPSSPHRQAEPGRGRVYNEVYQGGYTSLEQAARPPKSPTLQEMQAELQAEKAKNKAKYGKATGSTPRLFGANHPLLGRLD